MLSRDMHSDYTMIDHRCWEADGLKEFLLFHIAQSIPGEQNRHRKYSQIRQIAEDICRSIQTRHPTKFCLRWCQSHENSDED